MYLYKTKNQLKLLRGQLFYVISKHQNKLAKELCTQYEDNSPETATFARQIDCVSRYSLLRLV